jgi:hypothetical protein
MVQFRYNATTGLKDFKVIVIKLKVYATEDNKPLWAVEDL